MRRSMLLAASALALLPAIAPASETVTYTYDARGRLVQVAHSGSVNSSVSASYSYDKADNRTNLTATGSGAGAPSFVISNASVTEGGTLSFTVTRQGSTSGTNTVQYATANGSATAGPDYTAVSLTTLTFTSGQTTKTVTVATIDDAIAESSETVFLNLSNASAGSTIADAQGVGTILDNDTVALPSFSINDVSATEGSPLVFTITKSGSVSSSFSVNYATANGTTTSGSDYTSASGTLTFAATDVSKTVSVPTILDAVSEGNETVLFNLSGATGGATISDAQGVGTINNSSANNPPVTQADSLQLSCNATATVNVTANDSDPEGNTPLMVTSVAVNSGLSDATVVSASSVQVQAGPDNETVTATYTVEDSLHASANGTININIVGGPSICGGSLLAATPDTSSDDGATSAGSDTTGSDAAPADASPPPQSPATEPAQGASGVPAVPTSTDSEAQAEAQP